MNKEQLKQFNEYVNKYGFFHKGKLSLEVNGKIYSVDACMKLFNLVK